MIRIFVRGWGAVSPAGWDAPAMTIFLRRGVPAPCSPLTRPGFSQPLSIRAVPKPSQAPKFLSHPRLRRSSPISHFALSAALEALSTRATPPPSKPLGIVFCTMSGCVNYSRRFYDEVLKDPAVASPLLFPETVFNAPSSHLAAYLDGTAINYTVVGDSGAFLQGLDIACDWIAREVVGDCLVVAAEEMDWLRVDAFRHFSRKTICSEGAGALLLSSVRPESACVELTHTTDGVLLEHGHTPESALQKTTESLPKPMPNELLVVGNLDWPRRLNPRSWIGPLESPLTQLGDALAAGAAWQCIAACDAVANRKHPAARVQVAGPNLQAIAARFANPDSSP